MTSGSTDRTPPRRGLKILRKLLKKGGCTDGGDERGNGRGSGGGLDWADESESARLAGEKNKGRAVQDAAREIVYKIRLDKFI